MSKELLSRSRPLALRVDFGYDCELKCRGAAARMVIHDLAGLRALAYYDSGYLDQLGAV